MASAAPWMSPSNPAPAKLTWSPQQTWSMPAAATSARNCAPWSWQRSSRSNGANMPTRVSPGTGSAGPAGPSARPAASWLIMSPGGSGARPAGRPYVLVDVEYVVWVVPLFDPREPLIVAEVRRPDPVIALLHQEVDVTPASRRRMQLLPVVPGPLRDQAGLGRVRIDPNDDSRPAAIPVGKGCRFRLHPAGGTVDGIHVHRRVTRRRHLPVLARHVVPRA